MGARVMIVDDEPYIRLVVRRLLKRRGIELLKADCGAACLRKSEAGVQGADPDGRDDARDERVGDRQADSGPGAAREGNIIFMLTALETPGEQIEDLQQYVVDYITKPFEPEVLLATCETYLAYLEKMQTTGVS